MSRAGTCVETRSRRWKLCSSFLIGFSSLLLAANAASAYERAYAFVYPVGTEWERPTTSAGNPNGYTVTQTYCNYLSGSGYHTGTDMANGSTGGTVRSVANGKIVDKQVTTGSTGWGNMIRIEHTLTDGSVWYSQYGHMLDNSMTSKAIGSTVQMGESIGQVGNTGNSSGAHLHLEIKTSNSDGPGYISTSACDGSGFADPLAFIANRYLAQGTANNWQFETGGEKEGWTTLPFEQSWSVSGGLLRETIGQDTRIYSPYMNRTVNPKLYIKFEMTNSSACGVGQLYLQTANNSFNSTMVKHFSMPTNAGWATVVLAIKDVPEYDVHGNFRRFRLQMPGSSCAGGNWYFSYIKYVTDNVAPVVQNLGASPGGWTSVNSFSVNWSSYDGPDDGTGYGSGVQKYEISLNGGAWQDVGLVTSWSGSGALGSNTLSVRATDKVGNLGSPVSVNFYFDDQAPPPQSAYVIQTGWRQVNNFTFSWNSVNDAYCDAGYEYRLGSGGWVATTNSAMTFQAYQQGENTFQVRGVDCAGNRGAAATVPFYFDDVPPAIPGPVAVPAAYTNSNQFAVNWSPSSDAASGLAGYEYVLGAPGIWTTATSLQGALAYQEGINTFLVRARDVAGNWSAFGSALLLYDTVAPPAPTVTGAPGVPTRTNDFSFVWSTPFDPQGIAGYEYRFGSSGGAVWTTLNALQHASASRLCRDSLFVHARDNAGNWGYWGFAPIVLDTVAPRTPTLEQPAGWSQDGRFNLRWTSVADGCSDSVTYCLLASSRPDSCVRETLVVGYALSEERVDTVVVAAIDPAGNWARSAGVALRFDATAPVVAIGSLPGLVDVDSVLVAWSASDALSGVASVDVQYCDSLDVAWRDWVTASTESSAVFGPSLPIVPQPGHAYRFRARAVDVAGNASDFDGGTRVARFGDRLAVQWVEVVSLGLQAALPWRGVAWGDFDRDGLPDICATTAGSGARIYHNDGGGAFSDCTPDAMRNMQDCRTAVWGDFNRDGDLDVFVTSSSGGRLFRHTGNRVFVGITSAALGVLSGTGAAWGDYDGDGWLDLFVTTEGNGNHLIRNNMFGHFEDVTSGALVTSINGRGVAWCDYDGDGALDLYVAAWDQPSHLYRNLGSGQFAEVTTQPLGNRANGNGVAWGDADADGVPDLFITNFDGSNRLFHNSGAAGFVDVTPDSLALPGPNTGCAWADFDGDGRLDLYVATIGADALFRGRGAGQFDVVRRPEFEVQRATRGAAWADFDGDGDPDLLVADVNAPLRLLRNDNRTGNHWLKVRLIGLLSSPDGIGARVRLYSGATVQSRQVSGGSGYYSQDEPLALFGLGTASGVDSIVVNWPSGIHQVVEGVPVDQIILVNEATAAPVAVHEEGQLAFRLHGAQPNPTPGSTMLRFELPNHGPVSLAVFDVSGRLVRELVSDRDMPAGPHSVTWDARDADGVRVASGIYHYRLRAGRDERSRKIVVLNGR